jgi:hypothetical protein
MRCLLQPNGRCHAGGGFLCACSRSSSSMRSQGIKQALYHALGRPAPCPGLIAHLGGQISLLSFVSASRNDAT